MNIKLNIYWRSKLSTDTDSLATSAVETCLLCQWARKNKNKSEKELGYTEKKNISLISEKWLEIVYLIYYIYINRIST